MVAILVAVVLFVAVGFLIFRPSLDDGGHNVTSTLHEIKPRSGSPTLPPGGSLPGEPSPVGMGH